LQGLQGFLPAQGLQGFLPPQGLQGLSAAKAPVDRKIINVIMPKIKA
jgi:hypothetical protein